jgi:hypothetical protein
MQQRRGTAAEWTSANTVLSAGEIGFETDTSKFKIGDGTTAWNSLPYFVNADDIETGLLDTDEVSEGTTNLYFTDARAQSAVAGDISSAIDAIDTDDIEEGTANLYFTNQRAIDAVGENIALTDLSDVDTTGVADGYILSYDTSSTSWIATENAGGSGGGIIDITEQAQPFIRTDVASTWTTASISFEEDLYIDVQISDMHYFSENETYAAITKGGFGGAYSYLYTSTDAKTWTTQFQFAQEAYGLAYGNGVWVVSGRWYAVGGGGEGEGEGSYPMLMSSTNLISWTTNTVVDHSFQDYFTAQYGDNQFIAAGSGTVAVKSTDGTNWITFSISGNLGDTAVSHYEDGKWVFPGSNGIAVSTDSVNWNVYGSGASFSYEAQHGDADYHNNTWVVVNGTTLQSSTDTISWVSNISPSPEFRLRGITNHDNTWYASNAFSVQKSTDLSSWTTVLTGASSGADAGGTIASSTDTIVWAPTAIASQGLPYVLYSEDVDIFGSADRILDINDSSDLVKVNSSELTTITIPSSSTTNFDVKTQINVVQSGVGTVIFAPERAPDILTSPAGNTWTTASFTFEENIFGSGGIVSDLEYFSEIDTFAAVTKGQYNADYAYIYTSTDAVTWVTQFQFAQEAMGVAYGNGIWVVAGLWYAVGGGGEGEGEGSFPMLMTSTDLASWTTNSISDHAFQNYLDVEYGGGQFIALNSGNTAVKSTNGINWTTFSISGSLGDAATISYDNARWSVIGDSGIAQSTDGTNWQINGPSFSTSSYDRRSDPAIAYADGKWIVVSGQGLTASTNGVNWVTSNPLNINSESPLRGIAYYSDSWFVGTQATVHRSTDLVTWTTVIEGVLPASSSFGGEIVASTDTLSYFSLLPVSEGDGYFRYSEDVFGPGPELVTLNATPGLSLRDQWSAATLIKIDTDEWIITGDLTE